MRFLRPAVVVSIVLVCPPASGQAPDEEERARIACWIDELGSQEYAVREEAARKLRETQGRSALEQLEAASLSEDLEIRARARELAWFVRARPAEELAAAAGPQAFRYPDEPPLSRMKILEGIASKCGSESLSFVQAVLETEEDWNLWKKAREIRTGADWVPWRRIGGESERDTGPRGDWFLEDLALTGRAPGPLYRSMGEKVLEETWEDALRPDPSRERIVRIAEALAGRQEPIADPGAYAPWLRLLLGRGEDELAGRLLEAGLAGTAGDLAGRVSLARPFLVYERLDVAESVLAPLAQDRSACLAAIEALLDHRHAETALAYAEILLQAESGSPELREALASTFQKRVEVDRALALFPAGAGPPSAERARLLRYALRAEENIRWKRDALEAARSSAREKPEACFAALAEFVEECLWYGLGEEALAACLDFRGTLEGRSDFACLGLRAAVAALDLERAREFDRAAGEAAAGDPAVFRARLLLLLLDGSDEEMREAGRLLGRAAWDMPMRGELQAHVLALVGVESSDVPRWIRAEVNGNPGAALSEICHAWGSSGDSFSQYDSPRHWLDVRRKTAYLMRAPGAVDSAILYACLGERGEDRAVNAWPIFRLAGRHAEAAKALGQSPRRYLYGVDRGLCDIEAGRPERALELLAPLVDHEPSQRYEEREHRIALRLSALAARAAGEDAKAEAFLKRLHEPRLWDPKGLEDAGIFFTKRFLFDLAREEFEAYLAQHLDSTGLWEDVAGVEFHLAFLLAAACEYSQAADSLLRSLQTVWLGRTHSLHYTTRHLEPNLRATIETWRALDALSRTDEAAAREYFRRALAFDPLHAPAAIGLARLAGVTDPELARRANRLAERDLGFQIALEPANPGPLHELALLFEAGGKREEALDLARRAWTLAPDDRNAELLRRLER